jgi:tetratricopeptide (TPR) repeat protein
LYYESKGEHSKALEYYHESLKIDEDAGNQQGIATSWSNIGRVYMSQKKYDKALISFIKGLTIFEKTGDQHGISLILNGIGQVYLIQGDYKSAYVNANRSYNIALEIGFPNRISTSSLLLSQIYEKQHNDVEALKMYKLYIQMKDSVINENTKTDAVRQQSKYEYEKQKAVDDAIHEKQIAIEQ